MTRSMSIFLFHNQMIPIVMMVFRWIKGTGEQLWIALGNRMSCDERETISFDCMSFIGTPGIKANLEYGNLPRVFDEWTVPICREWDEWLCWKSFPACQTSMVVIGFQPRATKSKFLLIVMGIMRKPTLASYCNRDTATSAPFFLETMSRDWLLTHFEIYI